MDNQEKVAKQKALRKSILSEYMPMGLAFVGIVICSIVFKQRFINTLPVCISLLIMLFNARANRIGFLMGAANSMIYLVGYFSERLYGTVLSTIFGAAVQLASFFQWKKHSYKENSTQFRTLKNGWRIAWITGILIAWSITSFVLWKTDGNEVVLDGLVLVLGIILPLADMFAVIDALPLKLLNLFIQLIIWVKIVCEGNIANITYVIIMLYNVYMGLRQAVRWVALYKEQKALRDCNGDISNIRKETMEIKAHKIATDFKGEYCYTHARGAVLPSGDMFITTQPLLLTGVDVFYGMEQTRVDGKTFSAKPITKCEKLIRKPFGENAQIAICDCTPLYHKATGKILLLGHSVIYTAENRLMPKSPRYTVYAVYDEEKGDFGDFSLLDMGDTEYYNAGNGSGQSFETENGELLIPISYRSRFDIENGKYNDSTAVVRCAFDGEKLTVLEIGTPLTLNVGRGLCEASVTEYNGEYFLCLRNDNDGYLAKSKDGLHYGEAIPLCFDDGESVGNYCTQQHWITGGGKLWLVYTRRGADNDHVFRHRAPLFIAEVDPVTLRVIRATEKIAVPNRGARLGNFGCCQAGDRAFVVVSEWMQYGGRDNEGWKTCMQYGSDNSIFVSEITFD